MDITFPELPSPAQPNPARKQESTEMAQLTETRRRNVSGRREPPTVCVCEVKAENGAGKMAATGGQGSSLRRRAAASGVRRGWWGGAGVGGGLLLQGAVLWGEQEMRGW